MSYVLPPPYGDTYRQQMLRKVKSARRFLRRIGVSNTRPPRVVKQQKRGETQSEFILRQRRLRAQSSSQQKVNDRIDAARRRQTQRRRSTRR